MTDDDKELKDQRVVTMMSPSELDAIDDWMFKNRIRSRGEAIRRLCKLSLVKERSNARSALDAFMDASIKLIEAVDTLPEPPKNVTSAVLIVLDRMFEALDAQIADSARSLPITSGMGNIRDDLEQADRVADFLHGKSVMKLINESPDLREKLAQRLAEARKKRDLPPATNHPDE